MRRISAALLVAFALTAAACPKGNEMRSANPDENGLRPPGNPDRAVQAELDEARRKGTIEAYDLFLARQRQHPLAEVARRERGRIAARGGTPPS